MVYQTQKYAKTMAKAFRGMTNCLSQLTFCHTAMTPCAIFGTQGSRCRFTVAFPYVLQRCNGNKFVNKVKSEK